MSKFWLFTCLLSGFFTIFIAPEAKADSLSLSVTNATCNSSCDGTSTVDSIAGGLPPYKYFWSNGDTTPTADSLCAGTYTITVIDGANDTIIDTVTITEPVVLSGTLIAATFPSGHNISCKGQNDGVINLTVSGGTPPYNFLWSSGNTTEDITGRIAGTYTISITDANGCEFSDSEILTEPAALSVSIINVQDDTCAALCSGQATASIFGGASPYIYLWTSGEVTDTAISLCAGTNTVVVTDINNCTVQPFIFITEPAPFVQVQQVVKDVSICKEDSFKMSFSNVACDTLYNIKVTVILPDGVLYIPGSVASNLDTIDDFDIDTLNRPVFNISVIPDTGLVNITYMVRAGCGAITTDTVFTITGLKYSSLFNSIIDTSVVFIVKTPVLSISQTNIFPASYAGNVKDSICRTIKVKNTGNAALLNGFTLIDRYGPSVELISATPGTFTNDTGINRAVIIIPDSLMPPYGLMPDNIFVISECLTLTECTETNQGSNLGESVINYRNYGLIGYRHYSIL